MATPKGAKKGRISRRKKTRERGDKNRPRRAFNRSDNSDKSNKRGMNFCAGGKAAAAAIGENGKPHRGWCHLTEMKI